MRDLTRPDEGLSAGAFGIQPNPTRDEVTFSYLVDHVDNGMIVIKDLSGKVITSFVVGATSEQITWDSAGLAPGVYLVEFVNSGTVLKTEKLIVQR
ncbi:MAG: T9SS type A sorting domain-containing protein [Bacteroidota bacterium]|nr:T9SS type A sorting domain-containing protein [Bacteroidota bacterium]